MTQPLKKPAIGEGRDQELLSGATSYVYHESEHGELVAHFFFPADFDNRQQYSAIIFFHGGLWDISAPTQFVPHCHHFAARGMVAVTMEYRCKNKHHTFPASAVQDAQMALAFVKLNAAAFGIDTNRVAVCGAGSGAHLALCTALLDPNAEEQGTPYRPDALILFSPVTDTTKKGTGFDLFPEPMSAKGLSPNDQLPKKDLPPALIFHGTADRLIPISLTEKFVKRYKKKGNKCELLPFENASHTFFNFNTNNQYYGVTLRSSDHFLVDLGYLSPDPIEGDW